MLAFRRRDSQPRHRLLLCFSLLYLLAATGCVPAAESDSALEDETGDAGIGSTEMGLASTASLVNVAVGKRASQSSTAFGGVAPLAIDGNVDGNFHAGSVTHSDTGNNWWEVDLFAAYETRTVNVHNRTDCCGTRLNGAVLKLLGAQRQILAQVTMTNASTRFIWSRTDSLPVRYVRIEQTNNYLSLAEVEVLADPTPVPGTVEEVGRIEGTFSVSSGTANYLIPIKTAPGAGGLKPELHLVYNHQAGNDLLGVGWSLAGLPSIARCPATHAQDNFAASIAYNDNDRYCLEGQRLIANLPGPQRATGYGKDGTVYFLESNEWTRIKSVGNCNTTSGCYFVAQNRSGLQIEFGRQAQSAVKAIGQSFAYQWMVSKVKDPSGNYYVVDYTQNEGVAYPNLIRYTYNDGAGLTDYQHAIGFYYNDVGARSDRTDNFRAGEKHFNRRLEGITLFVNKVAAGGYSFDYDASPSTTASRLTNIHYCYDQACLAPTRFTYSAALNGFNAENAAGSHSNQVSASGSTNWTQDVTGDGYPDQVYLQSNQRTLWVLRNGGNGTFGPQESWGSLAKSISGISGEKSTWIADINNDGLNDFVYLGVQNPNTSLYVKLGTGNGFGQDINWGNLSPYNRYSDYPPPFLTDVNSDGRLDLVYFFDGIRVQLNTGSSLGASVVWSSWNNSTETAAGTSFADMNGDGLTDLVYRTAQTLKVRLNTYSKGEYQSSNGASGFGFSTPIPWASLQKAPMTPDAGEWVTDLNGDGLPDYLSRRPRNAAIDKYELAAIINNGLPIGAGSASAEVVLGQMPGNSSVAWSGLAQWLGDINADGFVDYVYLESGSRNLNVALSQHGRSIASATTWQTATSQVAWSGKSQWLADLNSDGSDDYLYLADGSRALKTFVSKGAYADLLEGVVDGLKARTIVRYTSLVKSANYRFTKGSGYPLMAVMGPRSVVYTHSELNGDENDGGQQRRFIYFYEDGFADLTRGGEFKFGAITVDDLDKEVVRTQYHQSFPLDGRVMNTETRSRTDSCMGDGNPSDCPILSRVESYYKAIPGADSYQDTYRVLTDRVRASHYDGNSSSTSSPRYVTGTDYAYDAANYDNLVTTTELGDTADPDDDVTYCRSYYNDVSADGWFIGLVLREKVSSTAACDPTIWVNGTDLSLRVSSYLPGKRKPRNVEVWDNQARIFRTSTYGYDAAGNPTDVTNPENETVHTAYDPTLTFPIEVTTPNTDRGYPLVSRQAFDPFHGVATMTLEPSGLRIERTLDSQGRVIEVRRGPTGALSTVEKTQYRQALVFGGNGYVIRHSGLNSTGTADASWLWQETGFDAWSQERYNRSKANDSKIVRVQTEYDAMGRITKRSQPYFEGTSPAYNSFLYDRFGNVSQVTSANNTVETIAYHLGDPTGGTRALVGTLRTRPSPTGTGTVQTREYKDVFGKVRLSYAADGNLTTYDYDKLGRLVLERLPGNTSRSYLYGSAGDLVSSSDSDTGTTVFYYDRAGRLTESQDAMGHVAAIDYDALGRVKRKQTLSGAYYNYTDNREVQGEQLETTFEYDDPNIPFSAGRLTRVVQSDALATVGITGPNSNLTRTFGYDLEGHVIAHTVIIDGRTFSMGAEFDPAGRLVKKTFPDGAVQRVEYQADPDPHGVFYRRGNDAELTLAAYEERDALGNLRRVLTSPGSITSTRTFDVLGRPLTAQVRGQRDLLNYSYEWSAANKLLAIRDLRTPSLSETYAFDSVGMLRTATRASGAKSYAYDANGNITSKEGLTLTYAPGTNRLASVSGLPDQSAPCDYQHNANGEVVLRDYSPSYGGYLFREHMRFNTFNGQGSMIAATNMDVFVEQVTPYGGTQTRQTFTTTRYAYDAAGTRIAKRDNNGDLTLFVTQDYEVLIQSDREVHTQAFFGPSGLISTYSYDLNPELADLVDTQNMRTRATMTRDPLKRAGLIFEASAQVILDQFQAYSVLRGLGASALWLTLLLLVVNALLCSPGVQRIIGRCSSKVVASVSPRMAMQRAVTPLLLLALGATLITPGTARADLSPGQNGRGNPSAASGGYRFFFQDHRFSSAVVTNLQGVETARVKYEPYGELEQSPSIGTDDFRPKFVGSEWQNDVELYHMGSRYYDPMVGRFMSPDPMRQYASSYEYAANDPLTFVDPNGEWAWMVVAVVAAVGVGLAVGYLSGVKASGGDWNPTRWDWHSAALVTSVTFGFVIGAITGATLVMGGAGIVAAGGFGGFATCQGIAFMVEAGSFAASLAFDFAATATDNKVLGIMATVFGVVSAVAGLTGAAMSMMKSACFAAGTEVALDGDTVPIEEIEVGDRVLTTAGQVDDTEVDPISWRKVHMIVDGEDGDPVGVTLLRPVAWLEETGVEEGHVVHVELDEMGIDGEALVLSVEPAPKLKPGKGRVVLGTFNRVAASVLALFVAGVVDPVVATASHPMYSASRQGWVSAGNLQAGELLQKEAGTVAVQRIVALPGNTQVFNLEVEAEHEYFVSRAGIRVHNTCVGGAKGAEIASGSSAAAGSRAQANNSVSLEAVHWPDNDGFLITPSEDTLKPDYLMDRYGEPTGFFTAPSGTPFRERALPASSQQKTLYTYRVVKPIEGVFTGRIRPWFSQTGMGIQHRLPRSVESLVQEGYLERILN